MTLAEIESFSKQLGNLLWLSFSGGEPFLREDIDKIYETYLRNNKVNIFNCPTNGILTDTIVKKTANMLKLRKINTFSINLSLDGLKSTHDSVRGVKSFDNVIETYDGLVKLRARFPWLLLKVNTTISNRNIHEIVHLHSFVRERMPEVNFHSFDIIRGTPKDSGVVTPDLEQLEELKPELYKIWDSYLFYGGLRAMESKIANKITKAMFQTSLDILKTGRQPFLCYAGKVHCVMDNNGDIRLCELLPPVGNIRKNSFQQVWHSDIADKQRAVINKKGCTCTHLCFQNTNFMFNPKNWPKIVLG